MYKLTWLMLMAGACASNSNNSEITTGKSTDMQTANYQTAQSIHSFSVAGLDGDSIHFNAFKGKKILIVNTASECGYTPQYAELEKLYKAYSDKLVVIGFPANNFGQQEPGTNAEIRSFCTKNYGVSFPMAAKISVKGNDIAPIYRWLTQKSFNGVLDAEVSWNFNKFLLDENGNLLQHFKSSVAPEDASIIAFLK